MKWKLIRDIRYFETDKPVQYGSVDVRYLGTIYPVGTRDPLLWYLGDRYSQKLAEYGFKLPGYHHVYIVLTPLLPQGEASLKDVYLETWQQFVTVGMPAEEWVAADGERRFECLVNLTTDALHHLCGEYEITPEAVDRTGGEVLASKTELEIGAKQKETSSYTVRISYQIAPPGKQSVAYIEYRDKKRGREGKMVLTSLSDPDDIHFLVGSISVSKGVIRLSPRASFKASLHTRSYPTPLEVPIDRVLAAGDEENGGQH